MALSVGASGAAARQSVDPSRSTITVRVFKAGLFRAFGDNHEIQAPIKEGSVDDGAAAGVQIVVNARQLRVLDPGLSPHDREQVQSRMLGSSVLDVTRFPEIRFESTTVDPLHSSGWTVHGRLTLHGQTRPVTVKVSRERDHYRGSVSLKQTDFDITPVSVAGGTVKVKDEVTIEFDIVTRHADVQSGQR
jgi:polyisoprenoid-binding protein YceI